MRNKSGLMLLMACLLAFGLVFTGCDKGDNTQTGDRADIISQWTNVDDFEGMGKVVEGLEPYQTYNFYSDGTYLLWNHLKDIISEEGTYTIIDKEDLEDEDKEITIFINTLLQFENGVCIAEEWDEFVLQPVQVYEMKVTYYDNTTFSLDPPLSISSIEKYKAYVITGEVYSSYTQNDTVLWVNSWHVKDTNKYQKPYIK